MHGTRGTACYKNEKRFLIARKQNQSCHLYIEPGTSFGPSLAITVITAALWLIIGVAAFGAYMAL